jgi:hypothetical protein
MCNEEAKTLNHRYPQGMEPFNASAVTASVGA